MYTIEELEDLQEIEKDFDKETARRVYEAGYRKVFNKYTCRRCGKEFMGHDSGSLYVVKSVTKTNGPAIDRVRLCNSCWLLLCERREKVDERFFSERTPDIVSGIAGKI